MSTDTKAETQRPTPKPAAEREAAIARYAVKGVKSCDGMDGVAWSLTLVRDGKPVAKVNDDGRGGEVSWHGLTDGDYYLRAGGLIDEIEADAVAWFVGSDVEKGEWGFMKGKVPGGCRDILVEELMRREDERKWLMTATRGAKTVLFQVGDAIGTQGWRQFPHVGPERTAKAVEKAKAEGSPVRVVWREGKVLRDEVFGK